MGELYRGVEVPPASPEVLLMPVQNAQRIIPPKQPLPATKAIDAAHRANSVSRTTRGRSASGLPPQAFLRETRQKEGPQAVARSPAASACSPCEMTTSRLAVPAASSRLNPHAEAFTPKQAQPANFMPSVLPRYDLASNCKEGEGSSMSCDMQALLRFMDIPCEILSSILCFLDDPSHVAAAALTCKRLRGLSKTAPLRLRIAPGRFMVEGCDGVETLRQDRLRVFLTRLCAQLKGVSELSLRHLPIGTDDLEQVTAALPQLRTLHLSGAQKLPPDAVSALLAPQDGRGGSPGLRAVSFVRCFQMTPESLDAALAAAAGEASSLRMVAFSHLDLAGWREKQEYVLPVGCGSSSSSSVDYGLRLTAQPLVQRPAAGLLQILSLHNCTKLRSAALSAIAGGCPQLRMLMLGGCGLALTPTSDSASGFAKIGEAMRQMAAGRLSRAESSSPLRVIGIVDEGQYICSGSNTASGLQMLREAVQNHNCSSGSMTAANAEAVAQLCALAAQLPSLQVLELTHLPPLVVDGIRDALQGPRPGVALKTEVWDLCRPQGVRAPQAFRERSRRDLCASSLALALQEAVNCSSQARQTPLHAAAEAGDGSMVKALLGMGAAVNARDKSGGTPLSITAEEQGRSRAAAALLAAGADVRAKNAAGEAPLYIAALRGIHDLVQLLLMHHEQHCIAWTAPGMYGDGWTPLMACCVAGHLGIASFLLRRAGHDVRKLVLSANRYGLTAGHIAARRGDVDLLHLLLQAAGGDVSKAKDSNGETPIIVAIKYKHASAAQLLTDALRWPKVSTGQHLPMPYHSGTQMPSKRRSLDRPECY